MTLSDTSKDQPGVSIVIPTYNHEAFLGAALRSVVNQTYTNWEAIVVNNFSTDGTEVLVHSFNDPRIKLVNFHNNGIIGAARNQGINLATNTFVAFLDSDDTWLPTKLEKCIASLVEGADLVCHGENWIDQNSNSRSVFYGPTARATYLSLLFRGNRLSTSATVVRTSILKTVGGFSENSEFVTAEDYEMWLKISRITKNLVFIDEILGNFMRHGASASSSVEKHLHAEISVVNHHAKQLPNSFATTLRLRHRKAKAYYSAGRSSSRGGQIRSALKYFVTAIKTSPLFVRSYAAIILLFVNQIKARVQ